MNLPVKLRISFSELHYRMTLDPFYGRENTASESIINHIFHDNSENTLFLQFRNKYFSKPLIRNDHQRQLIYLWCQRLDLPSYYDGDFPDWQMVDYLDEQLENSEIQLNELKSFLRKNLWPLPEAFFPDEVDNTRRKIELVDDEFNQAFNDFVIVLPKLEGELEELKNTPVISMAERAQKHDEIVILESHIKAIHAGKIRTDLIKDIQNNDYTKLAWINIAKSRANELLNQDSSLTVKELATQVYKYLKTENIKGRGNKEITKENIRRNALAGIKS